MAVTKVEITYHGKIAERDPKTQKAIQYHKKYTIEHVDNWKESYVKEFKGILDKFEGISEIRFFV